MRPRGLDHLFGEGYKLRVHGRAVFFKSRCASGYTYQVPNNTTIAARLSKLAARSDSKGATSGNEGVEGNSKRERQRRGNNETRTQP